jgi:hypothetical protein
MTKKKAVKPTKKAVKKAVKKSCSKRCEKNNCKSENIFSQCLKSNSHLVSTSKRSGIFGAILNFFRM